MKRETSLSIVTDFISEEHANKIISLMSISKGNGTLGNISWEEAPTKLKNGAPYYAAVLSDSPKPLEYNEGYTVNYPENTELWDLTNVCVEAIADRIKSTFQVDHLTLMSSLLRWGGVGAKILPHQDGPMFHNGEWIDIDFSCFIILNGDFKGGSLRFEELGLSWQPLARSAVFLSNTSTKMMVHEVEKVTGGQRFSLNTFFKAS
ncbi:Oxoglutarate/iron-dependent dioxygenase [uncultured Caudovirales phage]|uniref:Oxoglutarate/iron-dependent dioxygenase n=1 Tax=uncultured Caudovirales phage TaxID=2100421 RepID=A0A6J7WZ20_9CAUD|nr:Oxoglutarate/iron-dependent dioxygenase [uncultured Caudovirales phage]